MKKFFIAIINELSQGSRINYIRRFRRLTQDDVSNELGFNEECKRRSMTRYEKGEKKYIEEYIITLIKKYKQSDY